MITTTCTVDREGQAKKEIPLDDAVAGDIVHLSAGDMIPADVRIMEAKDLFISQSSLPTLSKKPQKSHQKGMELPDPCRYFLRKLCGVLVAYFVLL